MKIVLTAILLTSVIQFAQDKPEASKGSLTFYVDNAAFKAKDSLNTFEEFYFMLYADQLSRIIKDSVEYCEAEVNLFVSNRKDSIITNKSWVTQAKINSDSSSLKAMVVYDKWGSEFKPGTYNISVRINDHNGTNSGNVKFILNIPKIDNLNFSASQIEFVSDSTGLFPNPSRRYGILNPIMYFYYELYNLKDSSQGKINVKYSIKDNSGTVVKTLPQIQINKGESTASLTHGINVASLPTGIYSLISQITELPENKSITLSRDFEIIQMDYVNNFPTLTEEQAKVAKNYLKYIADAEEYKTYSRLDINGKSKFLVKFWKDHDPTPGTIKNEFLNQVQERYKTANLKFSWGKTEGWKTDRGRILIKYGQPNQIERHYLEPETVSYEIWYYHQNKNYEFVFADLNNNGQYVLLHSNRENEVHNFNWKEQVKKF